MKWQDGEPFTADDVAFTYNYIIDNEMGAFSSLTDVHRGGRGRRRPHGGDPLQQAQGQHVRTWIPILPEHIWSKVEPQGGRRLVPEQAAHRRHRALPDGRGQEGRLRAHGRQPDFWGQKPTIDEILFVTYQNPDTMTQDLLAGNLDAAWGIPSAQFPKLESDQGFTPIAYNLLTWDYLAMNCYEGTSRGNPVLKDVGLPPGAQLGASTGRRSSTSPGRGAASRARPS